MPGDDARAERFSMSAILLAVRFAHGAALGIQLKLRDWREAKFPSAASTKVPKLARLPRK
jgi:hypothetical protein